jgi:signal transduction histidine kinase
MARKRTTAGPSGYVILVVDDQEEVLISVKLLLERDGHRVLTAASGEEALGLFRDHHIDLVIVDYFMPGMDGETVVKEIRRLDDNVQILLQTGYSGEKPPRDMLRTLDIQGYHDKSEGPERLLLWVDTALKAAAQLKKVRETEQLKAQLLANISHELRTPLNVIIGYSELLLDEQGVSLLPHVQQTIEAIQRQAHALGFLINNFLNLAKIESEVAGIALDRVRLADFREEMSELMRILLREKPVAFLWQVDEQCPLVWADPQKLVLILRNLLSNAAKFTERGEVRVFTTLSGQDQVTLMVKDTGVGIAPEHHEQIFEAFHQVDGSMTRRFGGTGIGLTLSRKLARLMGGEITVQSTLGAGATFLLSLKAVAQAAYPVYTEPLPLQ